MKSSRDITSGTSSATSSFLSIPALITPMIVSKSLSRISDAVKFEFKTNCLINLRKFSFPSLAVIDSFFQYLDQLPIQYYLNG